AIVTEPKLLLMDEPLSNIDIRLREEIRQEIRRIQHETQITTVYVTHDQEDAFLLSDKVAVMNEGIIKQTGTPEEIYNSPISPFIAHFIGESNMINIKVLGKDRVLTPWGELDCNTKGRTAGNATLFFRPHQARIEKGGQYEGVIISRDFIGGVYRYHISTSGEKIKLQDQYVYEIDKSVRFSIKLMEVLFL
ncbi:MAG: ABC transporter ATP-binding protein, partial [Planctomycetota bacterium]